MANTGEQICLEYTTDTRETAEFDIKWNVHKRVFECLDDDFKSPIFCTKFYNSSWFIELGCYEELEQNKITITLNLEKSDVDLQFDTCYSLKCGKEVVKDEGEEAIDSFDEFSRGITVYDFKMIGTNNEFARNVPIEVTYETLNSYFENNSYDFLTIIFKIRVTALKHVFLTSGSIGANLSSEVETLSKDLSDLAFSEQYSDITLVLGEKKFKVYKGILACRCEYFAKMFGPNFKESTEKEVKIPGIDPEDFEHLLRFIYAGKNLDKPTPHMPRLLKAANQLGISAVELKCEEYLAENITINNCLELFEVAELYSCPNLKTKVKEFINANTKKVMSTEAWKIFKDEKRHLLGYLMELIHQE